MGLGDIYVMELVGFTDLELHSMKKPVDYITVTGPDNFPALMRQANYSASFTICLNSNKNSKFTDILVHFIK